MVYRCTEGTAVGVRQVCTAGVHGRLSVLAPVCPINNTPWLHLPGSGGLARADVGSRKRITNITARTRPLHHGSQRCPRTAPGTPGQPGQRYLPGTVPFRTPLRYAPSPYILGTPTLYTVRLRTPAAYHPSEHRPSPVEQAWPDVSQRLLTLANSDVVQRPHRPTPTANDGVRRRTPV